MAERIEGTMDCRNQSRPVDIVPPRHGRNRSLALYDARQERILDHAAGRDFPVPEPERESGRQMFRRSLVRYRPPEFSKKLI